MRSFHLLAIFSYIVFCKAQNGSTPAPHSGSEAITKSGHFCNVKCKDICIPCQEPVRCVDEETDCGLGEPDPAFGGVCPPHSKCVPKVMNCPCQDADGNDYPLTTIVKCKEDELLCTGASPGNGCPGQDVCIPKGVNNQGELCDGFCPFECEESKIKCSQTSSDGCAVEPLCHQKQIDIYGEYCKNQQCPLDCDEAHFFCGGDQDELGCKEDDICVQKGISNSGELCPGNCPVECDPVNEKHCEGPVNHDGCKDADSCHAKAKNVNGEHCPDNSDSHDCPVICPKGTVRCPSKMDILGCKEEPKCANQLKGINGEDCPLQSVCPTICQPNEVACSGGLDENGCNKPDICMPQERDYNGDLCPVHCPGICGDNEVLCDGHREAMGCKMPAICIPRGVKTKGSDIGGLCPGVCPVVCKHNEVTCEAQEDCDGCSTEQACRPKAKDNNGIYCTDDSASHDCPITCDETKGEVVCQSYKSSSGCKPKEFCIPRPVDNHGDYCPAHSACSIECESDELVCPDGADARGCKRADLCIPKGEDVDGNLCPGTCPPVCATSEFSCPGPIFNNGCRGMGLCIEKTHDINKIECPHVCPVFCKADEHQIHGGIDNRGCLQPDKCVAKCTGGDSCCSETNRCDVGEGDCDSDADCLDGLLCGTGNCPSTRSDAWDASDDCCFKPANPPQSCIEFGYHYIGDNTETVDKKDGVQSAEQCQSLCKADSRCNWFTWKDAANPTSCWLLTAKGTTKDEDEGRNQGATGPKTCFVSGCTVDSQAGDGTKQGTCDREHLCHADGTCKSEDHMYIATFKATGCTNDQPHTGWWKSQSEETVLNDMFKYCELTKDGSGSGGQKSQCCGSEDCTVTECVKQTGWTKA